jgi:ATP-dependent Lhr-like helicase
MHIAQTKLPGKRHRDTGLDRVLRQFRLTDREPFPFQRETWQHYADGFNGLILAPTGMGKTMAAAMGPIIEWLDEQSVRGKGTPPSAAKKSEGGETASARLKRRAQSAPLTVLWITPLRALAADTSESLEQLAASLQLPWSIELRTADTSATTRKRQRDRLPTVLITTPESLSVLLSYPGVTERFATLRAVIVDEWHELMASKRGVQTELGLARLRFLNPKIRIWGLSATIANPAEAAATLLGPALASGAKFVTAPDDKVVEIQSILPADITRFPWSGHLGLQLVEDVARQIGSARTTLVFTNTRSQSEIWFRSLLQARPDWIGALALHHGSLDRNIRRTVEDMLRQNKLRAAVCTSSLDLGVDFWPVDQVIQIGSPKSVARAMQRAGRSGHQPGAASRLICAPTQAFELIEFSAARHAIEQRNFEPRDPIKLALDVLAQHVVTLAASDGFDANELLAEVFRAHRSAMAMGD